MNQDRFRAQYETKSNIELLLIATNYDESYTNDAIKTATSILLSRYGNKADLEQIWNKEIGNLFELAEKCNICQNPAVAYAREFFLCSLTSPDIGSGIGIIAAIPFGAGFFREKYTVIKLDFRLCDQCLKERIYNKDNKEYVKISWQEYNSHPLCAFYKHLGYINIRD